MSGRWGDLREGTSVANETELLALVVLQAANRTQAKGSTVRLVAPAPRRWPTKASVTVVGL